MSSEENKKQFQQFFQELINSKNLSIFDALVAPNFVEHEDLTPFPQGREGVKQFFQALLNAFPDMQVTIDDLIAEGDKVVARSTMRGTHQGEFLGIPTTGKTINFEVIDILRYEDGKVVEHWGLTDNLSLLQQLGAIPESLGAAA